MTAGTATARIVGRRAAQGVAVALAVSTLCFVVVRTLPGDMALRIAAGRYGYDRVSAEAAEAVDVELGLDRPAWRQLLSWFGDLARLDLGTSLVTGAPVRDELAHHLAGSLQLAGAALAVGLGLGVGLGALAGHRPGGPVDRLTTAWVALVRALPPFLLGLLLVVVLSVQLGLLPAVGDAGGGSLVLPATTLGLGLSGLFAGVTRDAVGAVLASDHVRFARTKGLTERAVLARHVVRNTAARLVAYVGVQAVVLVEGVVVVESLFAWQGLGHALVHAVFWRDVPVLQGAALTLTLVVVLVNTLVDVGSTWLDPRPRHREVAA